MGVVLPFVPRNPKCQQCGGKPNEVYFVGSTGQVLAIICDACKAEFEAAITAIGRGLCADPTCEQCLRGQTQWT